MVDVDSIVQSLTESIEQSPQKQVSGSRLKVLLEVKYPDFFAGAYSCLNLRDFIRKYAPLLNEVGRAGADIIYGLRSAQLVSTPVATPERVADTSNRAVKDFPKVETFPQIPPDVLKTFSSPSAFYKLYGHPETGVLEVVPPGGTAPQTPWLQVPPCSASTHQQIATDFITTLADDSNKQFLSRLLEQPQWWLRFHLFARQLNLGPEWHSFRTQRIKQQLIQTLKGLGIPLRLLRPSAEIRHTDAPTMQSSDRSSRAERALRRLALAAIERMSVEELRGLRLSLGYIVDELEGQ